MGGGGIRFWRCKIVGERIAFGAGFELLNPVYVGFVSDSSTKTSAH